MEGAAPITTRGTSRVSDRGQDIDGQYMRRALELAGRPATRVSPDPRVGCLLVRDGEVVGEGFHERFGGPHAEPQALEQAGDRARGASAYVTLEPCAQAFPGKKTDPCVPALILAGVTRLVVAHRDPNPEVDGAGIAGLRAAGIEVKLGVMAPQAARLNRGFLKWITTGRPYVILKAARTSDNFVAATLTGNRWFTSAESRRIVHRLRAEVDGVMIGRRTAQVDNPRLTVREADGAHPRRIVLDTQRVLEPALHLFTDGQAPTLRFSRGEGAATVTWGDQVGVGLGDTGLDLSQVLAELGRREFTSVLVEGGPRLHHSFLEAGLVDEIMLFTAPQPADRAVQGHDGLGNAVAVPDDWHTELEADSGGDRLVISRSPEARARLDNLIALR